MIGKFSSDIEEINEAIKNFTISSNLMRVKRVIEFFEINILYNKLKHI